MDILNSGNITPHELNKGGLNLDPRARFDLTFKNWFMCFWNKITEKLILNVAQWSGDKDFHSRSPKTPLTFLFYWETSGLHLAPENFYKKGLYKRLK